MNDAHSPLRTVELPVRMRSCARDHRGYPIPFLMMPDSQISIDGEKLMVCLGQKLCMICGKKLDNKKWFIGGQATARNRLFNDPAMHEECARYALRVCPFLSNQEMKYRTSKSYPEDATFYTDPKFVKPDRSKTQVLMQTTGYKPVIWRGNFYALANRWRHVEHWAFGKQVETPPGLSAAELAEHVGAFDTGGMFEDELAEV
jgi:hypothetical protein